MITIKTLAWSNAFSYGADNTIDFSAAQLTQLVGKNGHGKSSIALILEEVLFNKNSKSIKKADIINRYVDDKHYEISLVFEKDGVEYTIKTRRGSTQTVKLYRGETDISAHTSTQTYKAIEDILGFDHKTFSQIVYQSNAGSLEFLTAPDTARKKFLIEILNLGKYTQAQEVFKETAQELSKDIAKVQAQVATVNSWLDKYAKTDLNPKPLQPVPTIPDDLVTGSAELEAQITGLDSINKKITQNNTYRQVQSKIKLFPIPEKPTEDLKPLVLESAQLDKQVVEHSKTIRDSQAFVKKIAALHGTCPTCLQEIDEAKIAELVAEQQTIQQSAEASNATLTARIAELDLLRADIVKRTQVWEAANKSHEEWEKYHALIDQGL